MLKTAAVAAAADQPPPVKRDGRARWSRREHLIFLKVYDVLGLDWDAMQTVLPGRSKQQVQAHWNSYAGRAGKASTKRSIHDIDLRVLHELEAEVGVANKYDFDPPAGKRRALNK